MAPIAVHMLTAYKNAERGIFHTLRGILEGIMKYRQRKKTNDITENMVSIESAGNPWIGPRWDLMASYRSSFVAIKPKLLTRFVLGIK